MVFKNELYPIHFYGRVRGECDGRLQNWPGIVNERPKFLAMVPLPDMSTVLCARHDSLSVFLDFKSHAVPQMEK